jgi:ActR/RegA family two-component response regulator
LGVRPTHHPSRRDYAPDGIEFIDWLGAERANVRLVVVTGFNPNYGQLAEKLAEARGLSSVTVLTKPVRVATLLKALRGDIV